MNVVEIHTSLGPGRLNYFTPKGAKIRVVLGHGAGGGIHARDLQAIAASLPEQGMEVVLVEQPWVVAGKKVAPNPARLDEGWLQLVAGLSQGPPMIVGGRSAGARVAARTAGDGEAIGCALLAFPLHAPGKPEKSRGDELLGIALPTLVVQGTRDTFGTADELSRTVGTRKQFEVAPVLDADHGFKVPAKSQSSTAQALDDISALMVRFAGTRLSQS